MSVRLRPRSSHRVGSLLVLLLALAAVSLVGAPAKTLAAGGLWKGTAEGIRVDGGQLTSGEVSSSSAANYQVELSFFFSVNSHGQLSGGGSGYYTDAHWHLSGVNGKEGTFGCEPPVSAAPFKVDVSGHRSGHELLLDLAIPGASESNEAYNCGANYTGFATTSHYMSESLEVVGGNKLHISSIAPTSRTLEKTEETGDPENMKTHVHIWSIAVTPPGVGSGGGSGPGGGAGGACSLSLTRVAARPSPGHAGKPIFVSFHLSAPAHVALVLAPSGGAPSTVVAGNLPRGEGELVWGGWLGRLPAPAGQYQLTVQAKACGRTRSQSVSVKTS